MSDSNKQGYGVPLYLVKGIEEDFVINLMDSVSFGKANVNMGFLSQIWAIFIYINLTAHVIV